MSKLTTLILISFLSISDFAQSEINTFEYKVYKGGTYNITLDKEHSFVPQYIGEHISGLFIEKDSVLLALSEINIDYKTAIANAKKNGVFTDFGTINNEEHFMVSQTWQTQQQQPMIMVGYSRFKENQALIISIILSENKWIEYEAWFRKVALEIIKI